MNTSLGGGNALKPYILQISKLSSDSAVANLIPTILSDANVYVFGELLQTENIQALTKGEYKKYHDLLSIFAYGRYSDYASNTENLPKVSPKQLTKLRQLTVVSLATENRVIPYSKLTTELGLSSTRECEEVIIDALYKGILTGKLDSGTKQVTIESALGRDVQPQDIDSLLAVLTQWEKDSAELVTAIEEKMKFATEEHEKLAKMKELHSKRLDETKANLKLIMESEMDNQGGMMGMMGGMMGMMGGMGMGGMPYEDDRGKGRGKDKKGKRHGM
eukprot:TRINITY_DN11555_c0_g1_i1.p1 TRINITY_DN11555_c0_g1~~TRINITY_DN11555_c0_g1_i1.p1  ORF type:complete len:296 (+),score=62.43 TRINITY_DN11555_c0_g1_i1:64-888(+)